MANTTDPYSVKAIKSSAKFFVIGKVFTAVLSITGFALVARLLTNSEYGYYVSALALVELAIGIGSGGLDWVTARYVPEYRMRAGKKSIRKFIGLVFAVQSVLYVGIAACLAAFSAEIASFLNIHSAALILQVYLIYLVVEGAGRLFRDQILGHMLLQRQSQLASVVRNFIWVLLLLVLTIGGQAQQQTLLLVALIDLIAASSGCVIAAVGLHYALAKSGERTEANWVPPTFRQIFALARSSYVSYLCSLMYGAPVVTLYLTKFAGIETAGAFGFARNLVDQVKRVLPSEIMMSIARPALVSQYLRSNDFRSLNNSASALFLVSIVLVSPILSLALAYGTEVIALVRSAAPPDYANTYFIILLLALIPYSHRRVIELVVHAAAKAKICALANVITLAIPVSFALTNTLIDIPPISAAIALLVAESFYNILVVALLRRSSFAYQFPVRSVCRIGAAVVFGAAISAAAIQPIETATGASQTIIIVLIISLLSLIVFKPISIVYLKHQLRSFTTNKA